MIFNNEDNGREIFEVTPAIDGGLYVTYTLSPTLDEARSGKFINSKGIWITKGKLDELIN